MGERWRKLGAMQLWNMEKNKRDKCTCVWGWDMLCRMKGANKERKKMPAV